MTEGRKPGTEDRTLPIRRQENQKIGEAGTFCVANTPVGLHMNNPGF